MDQTSWVLTETRLRAEELRRVSPGLTVLTRGDAFVTLLRRFEPVFRILSEREALLLLTGVVAQNQLWPIQKVPSLKSFLDAVRSWDLTERLLFSALQDSENSSRSEAIVTIRDTYQSEMRERRWFDIPAIYELLAEKLEALPKERESQFPKITVDRPFSLSALERRLLLALNRFTPCTVTLDPHLSELKDGETLEQRYFREVIALRDSVSEVSREETSTERLLAASSFLSPWEVTCPTGESLGVFAFREERDEAEAVITRIEQLLDSGVRPAEIQIIALGKITPILQEIARNRGVPLHLSQGESLTSSPFVGRVKKLIEALLEPSVRSLLEVFELATLRGVLQELDLTQSTFDECEQILPRYLEIRRMRHPKESERLDRITAEWGTLKGYRDRFLSADLQTLLLEGETKKAVFIIRRLVREFEPKERSQKRAYSLLALRSAGTITLREEAIESEIGLERRTPEQSLARVLSALSDSRVPVTAADGITVTELLDARSGYGKELFIVGAGNFPPKRGESTDQLQGEIAKRLYADGDRAVEPLLLIANLIRNGKSLAITYSEDRGVPPRAFLEWAPSGWNPFERGGEPKVPVSSSLNHNLRAHLLAEQEKTRCITSPDGLERVRKAFERDGIVHYSVSQLERYREAPSEFFLESVVGGEREAESLQGALPAIVGSLIHRILQRAAKVGFSQSALLSIAEEEFSGSEYPWDVHPVLSEEKRRILSGLRDENERFGPLKTALWIEENLLKAKGPSRAEVRVSLNLLPSVVVTGVIDRIDESTGGELSIWDYKTGEPDKISAVEGGESLQIPLYAEAVRQRGGRVIRGGEIALKFKPERLERAEDPQGGFSVEHLAIEKAGRGWERTAAPNEERIKRSLAFACEAHQRISTGDFRDPTLPRKEFRRSVQERGVQAAGVDLEAPLTLSPEQDRAADISKNIVLSAGAGSGKTRVVVARILKAILAGEDIRRVVAVTFTEKAAAELRSRVIGAFSRVLHDNAAFGVELSTSQRAFVQRGGVLLADAPIGTIHSLCRSLLGDALAEKRLLSTAERGELIEQMVQEHLRSGVSREIIKELAEAGVHPYSLRKEISKLVSKPAQLEKLIASYRGEFTALDRHGEELFQSAALELRSRLKSYFARLSQESFDDEQLQFLLQSRMLSEEIIRGDLAAVSKLWNLIRSYEGKPFRKSAKKPNIKKDLEEILENFPQGTRDAEEEGRHLAKKVIQIAAAVNLLFLAEKERSKLFDFDDLIEGTASLLRSDPEALKESRDRFSTFLIDEFQDTDERQWEILQLLSLGKSLFIVGDEKQGIYSFRGGDIRVFRRAEADIVKAGGERLSLVESYRSAPEIVNAVNTEFKDALGESYEALLPMRDEPGAVTHRELERLTDSASVIADAVMEELPHFDGGPQRVAVLARNVSDLKSISEELRAREVPLTLSHSRGFFELPEIAPWLSYIRVLANPESPSRVLTHLSSYIGGQSYEDLLKYEFQEGAEFTEDVERLRYERLSTLLELRLEAFRPEFTHEGFHEELRNVERFVDWIRLLEDKVGGGVKTLSRALDLEAALEAEAPNAFGGDAPVVLMTIHGAKGLEFPSVVVLDRTRSSSRAEFRIYDHEDIAALLIPVEEEGMTRKRSLPLFAELFDRELKKRSHSEDERLRYVAWTRAQERLVIVR